MPKENKLNHLSPQEWLRFTKSWFVHNPPPRKKDETLHPAKYPESLIEEFIKFFTKENQIVFDPFLGTGSTLIACQNTKRKGIGIELMEKYGKIAQQRIDRLEAQKTLKEEKKPKQEVVINDSFKVQEIWQKNHFPLIDFLITSPPYGPMLNKKGLVTEKREKNGLDLKYSEEENDLGNILDYQKFIETLTLLFLETKSLLRENAYLVVILQNYRNGPEYKTLAWDFAHEMKKHFLLVGDRLWCQDNKTLYPYGYRYSFVPNVHHHHCLIFRNSLEKNKNQEQNQEKTI